jgi:transposase
MIRIEFQAIEIEQLEKERWQHADPRVQRRLHALYYKALGYPHQEIMRLVGVSAKTLRSFLRLYQAGGLDELKTLHYPQPVSALAAHQASIESEFRERPAKSMKEAAQRIKDKTGVERSRFQVSRFLKQIGMSRLKVGQIPAKADIEQQDEFLKKIDAADRRSPSGETPSLLHGCCPFCLTTLSRLSVVFCPGLYSGQQWSPTLQCLGCP